MSKIVDFNTRNTEDLELTEYEKQVMREIADDDRELGAHSLDVLRRQNRDEILEFYSKQKKNARLFDGVIGCSRKECSEEEWVSFREAKAEVLDQVISYLMVSTYAAEA